MDQHEAMPPTPEEARARIRQVEELAWSGAPMSELTAAVKAVHVGCSVKIVTVDPGKRMFRAVRVTEPPIHKSRVSYPPAHIAPLGRANDIGQSLFYASVADAPGPEAHSNILACTWESKAEDGDLLAIGEWEAIEILPLYPFGFQATEMGAMMRGNQPWITESMPTDAMEVINAWESKIFTQAVEPGDERQYRVSVALTNYALGIRAEMETQIECLE